MNFTCMCMFTAHIHRIWEDNVFTGVCTRRISLVPGRFPGLWSLVPFQRAVPSDQTYSQRYPGQACSCEYPLTGSRTPTWTVPGQAWGNLPRDRTAERVLATRREVCLLWLCRRTFLFRN